MSHANWFGGIYQDPKNFFANMAVDPESWLRIYPEFQVPADQKKAWLADRTGAIVGVDTARRFGWKVGDRVPLQGVIYRTPDGSAVGVHHRRHLRLDREGRRQDAVLLPLRLHRTRRSGTRTTATIKSAGT